MPVISPCPITASRHSKQCSKETHLHLLNPCFSLSFFCIYCYSPMPAPKILFTILFFSWSARLQWAANFFSRGNNNFYKTNKLAKSQWLLTLNCFNSNIIPDGKILRSGCIWFWGYVHFEAWLSLDPGICLWQPPMSWQLCPSTQNSAAAQGNQL